MLYIEPKGTSAPFDILSAVKQGCILSPFIFILVIDFVLKKSLLDETYSMACPVDHNGFVTLALLTQKRDKLDRR